jgi:hypothetical protein
MNKILIIGGALVLVIAAATTFYFTRGTPAGEQDIAQMAKKGATDKELIDAIDRSESGKKVTADQIIELKSAEVSDDVIISLIRKNGTTAATPVSHETSNAK